MPIVDADEDGRLYVAGSGLEVPGLEAILEYGDASKVVNDRIPGALLINDHSRLERVRITQLDGLHDDPDGTETRQPSSDSHGEHAGLMLYRGRTVGLTGRVEAGNLRAMRDWWRKLRSQFGTTERDLLIHPVDEVKALRNEVLNPTFAIDTRSWDDEPFTPTGTASIASGVTTTTSLPIGVITMTGATGAGQLQTWPALLDDDSQPQVRPWTGQDVWLFARVKIDSATTTVLSILIGPREWHSVNPGVGASATSPSIANTNSQSSPATGVWYQLSVRVPAAMLKASTTYLTPHIQASYSTGGDITLHIADVAMVFLDPDDATPTAAFSGDTPGYEWLGTAYLSPSIGPTYAFNLVGDPRFENHDAVTMLLSRWASYATTGLTVDQAPMMSIRWSGNHVERSLYYKATKAADTTSRSIGVAALDSPNGAMVRGNRAYRFSTLINVIQRPVSGTFSASIQWLDASGAQISVVNGDEPQLISGVGEATISAIAPANAVFAKCLIVAQGVTTASAVLEIFVSDPCFVDIIDWDPGNFYGVGEIAEEVDRRRRIPRPFLLRKVRKAADMKAPEQQTRSRAWRDFTMSLRASDPCIYVLDEHQSLFKMTGSPQLVVTQAEVFTLDTAPVPAPTGYTSDGSTNLTGFGWTKQITAPARGGGTHPANGVGHHTWLTPAGGSSFNARPAGDLLTSYYASALGYTYQQPRVVLGCAPCGLLQDNTGTTRGVVLGLDNIVYANAASVYLKRVSSTTWLELRWNATTNAFWAPFAGVTAPYSFELWCSHNSSGTLSTTRLATWDYSYVDPSTVWNLPFDPALQPMWLSCFLDSTNTVTWQLWSAYPSDVNASHMLDTGSYSLPSALQALLGTTVAGSAGWLLKTARPDTDANWQYTAAAPPFMHYFEARKNDVPTQSRQVQVIGDADDTPPRIQLRGDLVDPLVTMIVPTQDGGVESSLARFIGTMAENNPVTVDMSDGTITDSYGNNAYSMLQPGGRFLRLRPGVNTIALEAADWSTTPASHVVVSWRDALG